MSETKSVSDRDRAKMENDRLAGNQNPHSTLADKIFKTQSSKKRYRSLLICTVCKGDAHCTYKTSCVAVNQFDSFFVRTGYNFDAISCESCKAFFRRNALKIPVSISHAQSVTVIESIFSLCRVNSSVVAVVIVM